MKKCLLANSLLMIVLFFMSSAFANDRPTITFNGQKFYLARAHYETDHTHSPVNVVEKYFPEGENSDNYTKMIERITYLQITDYKPSMKARLAEYQEDNKNIPFEEIVEPNKSILNVSFWWPFRPNTVYKMVYVFQEDKQAKRAMSYVVTELQFFDANKTTNEELVKQASSLLLGGEVVKAASQLSF
ncbi:MAG: hypothetical protein AB7I18_09820 [Candidatus Berkiella sp.]